MFADTACFGLQTLYAMDTKMTVNSSNFVVTFLCSSQISTVKIRRSMFAIITNWTQKYYIFCKQFAFTNSQ